MVWGIHVISSSTRQRSEIWAATASGYWKADCPGNGVSSISHVCPYKCLLGKLVLNLSQDQDRLNSDLGMGVGGDWDDDDDNDNDGDTFYLTSSL